MSILSPSAPSNKLLACALDYAARGFSIIPVAGKKSVGSWEKHQSARADQHELRYMFSRPEVTGMGVILGDVSQGLACRDFDTQESYQRWAIEHPGLTTTLPTVQTVRGRHVYFLGPEAYKGLGDGEYRGDSGHYCVLPPSLHPSGMEYRWQVTLPDKLPRIDPVVAGLLTEEPSRRPARVSDGRSAEKTNTPLLPSLPNGMCKQVTLPSRTSTHCQRDRVRGTTVCSYWRGDFGPICSMPHSRT